MAILREELQGTGTERYRQTEDGKLVSETYGIYDGIAESASDLTAAQTARYQPGSMVYCLSEQSLYVKNGGGLWEEVSA